MPPFSQDRSSAESQEAAWEGGALQTESASADMSMYRPLSAAAHSGSIVVGFYTCNLCCTRELCGIAELTLSLVQNVGLVKIPCFVPARGMRTIEILQAAATLVL